MGDVAASLAAKIEAAGLTEDEKLVLAAATSAMAIDDDEVVGFNKLGNPEIQQLGNFEIQDLMSRFNQAETLASSAVGRPLRAQTGR